MDASSFFFDLTELDNTRATSIVEMFLSNLHSNGFEDEFLFRNWISFGCDGASNMLGRHAGVAGRLVEKYPNLIVWHCSNHRLEIPVNDVVREMSAVCHMTTGRIIQLYINIFTKHQWAKIARALKERNMRVLKGNLLIQIL
jgi:hypothetical protein